jgi:hypothetical protein
MTNAEPTAESGLQRRVRQVAVIKDTQHTRMALRPLSYILTSSVSYSAASLYAR